MRAGALDQMIDAHLACEDEVAALEPPTPPRDRSADGAVVYQITCYRAVRAAAEGRALPMCAWVAPDHSDATSSCPTRAGFLCVVCGRPQALDSDRGAAIADAIK